jgi:hypothetical protein
MAINPAMLDEFNYFEAHRDEIVKGHLGELAVIKDREVKGYYKTFREAAKASKDYPLESFLIKEMVPDGYDTVRLYNRSIRFGEA